MVAGKCLTVGSLGREGGNIYIYIYVCVFVYIYPHILLVCMIYGTQFTNDILFIVNSIVLVDSYSMK